MALRHFPIVAAANIRSVGLFPYIETKNSKDCTVMLIQSILVLGTVKAFLKHHLVIHMSKSCDAPYWSFRYKVRGFAFCFAGLHVTSPCGHVGGYARTKAFLSSGN